MKTIEIGITWTKTAYHEYEVDVPDDWESLSKKEKIAYLSKQYDDDPSSDCYSCGEVTDCD